MMMIWCSLICGDTSCFIWLIKWLSVVPLVGVFLVEYCHQTVYQVTQYLVCAEVCVWFVEVSSLLCCMLLMCIVYSVFVYRSIVC